MTRLWRRLVWTAWWLQYATSRMALGARRLLARRFRTTEPAPVFDTDGEPEDVVAWIRLEDLLAGWRPGSGDWSWEEEETQVLSFWPGYQPKLEANLREHGFDDRPNAIILGDDGRVWDGHHRIVAAMRLGIEWVPVEAS